MWVVVVRTSTDQTVEVLGPFRSEAKATSVRERVESLEEKVEPWASWAPSVERCESNVGWWLKNIWKRFQ